MSELGDLLASRGARLALKLAGVVVVLGLVAGAAWFWLRSEDARGRAALAAAAETVQQGEGPQATAEARQKAIGMLQAVLDEHGRSSAATQAAYQLGNLQYEAGEYAAARAAYELALAKGAEGSLRTLSASGIGYTWEAQKSYANALTAFEAAARALAPGQFFFEEALLDLARAQTLAGKPAEARATYERLLKDAPETRRAEVIRGRLAALPSSTK
ncbi:MAG: tetratricopeptide repeat protein [Candidatus Rokuibacteriota bacterium]